MCDNSRCNALSKKSIETVVQTGNIAVVQVKSNQKCLYKACQIIANNYNPIDVLKTSNLGHGRDEKRVVCIFSRRDYLKRYIPGNWQGLVNQVVMVVRERKIFDPKGVDSRKSYEYSYYITTSAISAKEAEEIIRRHWRIENSNHYVRDEIMGEDKSRIRKNPMNMVILRSMALNLLRQRKVENIKQTLYRNSLSIDSTINFIKTTI